MPPHTWVEEATVEVEVAGLVDKRPRVPRPDLGRERQGERAQVNKTEAADTGKPHSMLRAVPWGVPMRQRPHPCGTGRSPATVPRFPGVSEGEPSTPPPSCGCRTPGPRPRGGTGRAPSASAARPPPARGRRRSGRRPPGTPPAPCTTRSGSWGGGWEARLGTGVEDHRQGEMGSPSVLRTWRGGVELLSL